MLLGGKDNPKRFRRLAYLFTFYNIWDGKSMCKRLDFTRKSSEGIEELQEALEEAFLL